MRFQTDKGSLHLRNQSSCSRSFQKVCKKGKAVYAFGEFETVSESR